MKSVFLDVVSALYQRPVFTTRLLITHGFKKMFWNPLKALVTKVTPYSVQLRYAALMMILLGNGVNEGLSQKTSRITKNGQKSRLNKKNATHKKDRKREKRDGNSNQKSPQSSWSLSNLANTNPVNWVMEGTQNILQNGLSFLTTEEDEIRSQRSSISRMSSSSSSVASSSHLFTPPKSSQSVPTSSYSTPLVSSPSDSFWEEDTSISRASPPTSFHTPSSATSFIVPRRKTNKDEVASTHKATPNSHISSSKEQPNIGSATTTPLNALRQGRQARRQKSSRASFSSSSTILSGDKGAW